MPVGAEARFARVWAALGARGDSAAAFADLASRYAGPTRAYHTMQHVQECLEELDSVRGLAADPDAVEAAVFFHDAVYDPRAADSEERSAALARSVLGAAGVGEAKLATIAALILETRHRSAPKAGTDAALLVDLDLAILGAEPERFDRYEQAVRREYAHVSEDGWRTGRARVLRGFLARERIFTSDVLRARYEARARANLARSVAALS